METNNTVGVKELRENLEEYVQKVGEGKSFTVFRRSKPVFKLVPVEHAAEDMWEPVIDFTELNPKGIKSDTFLKALKRVHG